ncbi:MAG: YggT family protein [Chloroflexi bacterium]|nr:YggT family protein [Chloroflexota bacterium]MCY3938208.1 YggT family protein [Chloroflexota bacterium]MCY4109420.1 YggT family protein [Chloroflexota bacterium]
MAPIIHLVVWIINALTIVIFIRSILSWFIQDPYHPVMKLLIEVTEPILQPLRRVMPQTPGFDLTPFVAMLALQLLQRIIVSLLVV